MKNILTLFVLLIIANLFIGSSWASIDVYDFESELDRQKYHDLTKQLRCPKCQNQDISDSNSPIASDMRREVHRLILEGSSHEQVIEFMVERFGEFVSYRPSVGRSTYLLWFGPLVLGFMGVLLVVLLAKRRAKNGSSDDVIELNQQDKEALSSLLSAGDKGNGDAGTANGSGVTKKIESGKLS